MQIKRYELIELNIPASALGKVTFATYPQLQNQSDQLIKILNIEVFPITSYAASQLTAGLPGMPVADVPKAALVLYVNGEESIHLIPLAKLIHIDDAANPFQFLSDGFETLDNVDFSKSSVRFNTAATAANYIIPFGITYIRYQKSATGTAPSGTPPRDWIMA